MHYQFIVDITGITVNTYSIEGKYIYKRVDWVCQQRNMYLFGLQTNLKKYKHYDYVHRTLQKCIQRRVTNEI